MISNASDAEAVGYVTAMTESGAIKWVGMPVERLTRALGDAAGRDRADRARHVAANVTGDAADSPRHRANCTRH